MAHLAKYTRGAVGHMTKHYERAKDESGEYVKFGNENIDLSRSHLNYNLATHQQGQLDRLHERLGEVYCMKRKDVNVLCSWVVTAPKDLPAERQREFFERSYKFLEDKYGKENVISAYVHMDETTPHMHFAFIPVVYDKKKDREKVSSKEVITRTDIRAFHTEYQAEMDKFAEAYNYEFECNVLNGATEGGNLTIQGMKAKELEAINEHTAEIVESFMEQANEEAEKLQDTIREREEIEKSIQKLKAQRAERINDTLKECESLEKSVKVLKADKSTLEAEITALEGKLDGLKADKRNLIEEFFKQFPNVKEAFEKFCDIWQRRIERERNEAREKREEKIAPERNKGVMSMDEWQKAISDRRSSSPVPERKPNLRINRDEHER